VGGLSHGGGMHGMSHGDGGDFLPAKFVTVSLLESPQRNDLLLYKLIHRNVPNYIFGTKEIPGSIAERA
jgi:hypothetical protein